MSSYFDETHEKIRACADTPEGYQEIQKVEEKLVFDVTVCAMFPDFWPDLRAQIHEIVLQYGVYTLPVNAPQADFDTFEQHRERIHRMCWDLHSVFHDVVRRSEGTHSDTPLYPLRLLYCRGEEEREKKAVKCLHQGRGKCSMMTDTTELTLAAFVREAHATSRAHGWWREQEVLDRSGETVLSLHSVSEAIPEKLCLIHSEVSEALKAYRDGQMAPTMEKGKPVGFASELADILIRIGDLCGALGIDLGAAVREKMAYNQGRPYRHGGKTC